MKISERINCFARIAPDCLHGKPLTAESPEYEMPIDGTYVGAIDAVCCTPCYVAVGMPDNKDLTLAIMAKKGVRVIEEEVDAAELEPGDLWSSLPVDWLPGVTGMKIAIRSGNVIDAPERVYRIRLERT